MRLVEETSRNDTWIFFNVYDLNEKTNTKTFITTASQLTDESYNKTFGIMSEPTKLLKGKYGWDITDLRWSSIVNTYDNDVLKSVYVLYEATNTGIDVNQVIDIILTGKKLNVHQIKEYLTRLNKGEFTKQDGKDIMSRLEAGEDAEAIYSDKKYEKIAGVEDVVNSIFEKSIHIFAKPEYNAKNISWLVGQVMKETKGKCNPQEVKNLIEAKVNSL